MHQKLKSKLRKLIYNIPVKYRFSVTHKNDIASRTKNLRHISLAYIIAIAFGLALFPSFTDKAYAAVSATLTIDSPSVSGSAEPGGVAYAKSNITYNVSDTSGWSLKISYANGKSALTGGNTISGADNRTPSAMANNTWGYAWSDSTSATQSNLTYNTMPAYGSPADMKTGNANISTTGSINFAAKFAPDATPGHYNTDILVSLVASPPLITYTLRFNSDAIDGMGRPQSPAATNMPDNQTCQTASAPCTITINPRMPSRDGYSFLGWSKHSISVAPDPFDPPEEFNTIYQPGEDITISANTTLYARWGATKYNYNITYNCNTGTGCPANDSGTDSSYTIPTTLPTRSGYDFLGWSTTSSTNTTTATAQATYGPGKKVNLSANTTINLYAIWRTRVTTSSGFTGISTMQAMTSNICGNAAKGASKTLTDSRDNSTYTITKLADGKCWMTQNLKLKSGTTLTNSTSNVSTTFTLPASSNSFITAGVTTTDPGLSNGTAGRMKDATNANYGAYYSFNAATAGTKVNASSGTASYDICPKNWRLPTQNEYTNLLSALGINDDYAGRTIILGAPNKFVAAGYIKDGLTESATTGLFWSSTIYSNAQSYALFIDKSGVYPGAQSGRALGLPIRCVAK